MLLLVVLVEVVIFLHLLHIKIYRITVLLVTVGYAIRYILLAMFRRKLNCIIMNIHLVFRDKLNTMFTL